jgi:hypothetical protein
MAPQTSKALMDHQSMEEQIHNLCCNNLSIVPPLLCSRSSNKPL